LNHFKKLGRATLVADGANSLLGGRGGRGLGNKRRSDVAMGSKPENARDSYGANKLTKEELAVLAEAAKNRPRSMVSKQQPRPPSIEEEPEPHLIES
jgi:hypothetical protein